MLSSGCCLIQLAANAASIGCLGFASLEPLRLPARAATIGVLGHLLYRRGLTHSTLSTLVVALAVMGSQDALRAYNSGAFNGVFRLRQRGPSSPEPPPSAASTDSTPPLMQQVQDTAPEYLRLSVAGIKCEGCASHLRSRVLGVEGVERCSVHFERGEVEVWAQPGASVASAVVSAIQLTDLSYSVKVLESNE